MSRTVNPAVYTVRRDSFLDVAQGLIQEKGYEQMTIQDVLDRLEASRGAFYHYFDSKQTLLEAVVDRMVDVGLAATSPVVDDPSLSAIPKFEQFLGGIGRWKTERKPFMLELIKVWVSDDNAIFREKVRRTSIERLAPLLTRIIQQGVDEGTFSIPSAADVAVILVRLLLGFQDAATELFIARQDGRISYDDAERAFEAYSRAFERILGAPVGSIKLADRTVLREWFG